MSHFKAHATNSYADAVGNYIVLKEQHPHGQIAGGPLNPMVTIKVNQASWDEWSSKKQHWFHVNPPLQAGNIADPKQIYNLDTFELVPHPPAEKHKTPWLWIILVALLMIALCVYLYGVFIEK